MSWNDFTVLCGEIITVEIYFFPFDILSFSFNQMSFQRRYICRSTIVRRSSSEEKEQGLADFHRILITQRCSDHLTNDRRKFETNPKVNRNIVRLNFDLLISEQPTFCFRLSCCWTECTWDQTDFFVFLNIYQCQTVVFSNLLRFASNFLQQFEMSKADERKGNNADCHIVPRFF